MQQHILIFIPAKHSEISDEMQMETLMLSPQTETHLGQDFLKGRPKISKRNFRMENVRSIC